MKLDLDDLERKARIVERRRPSPWIITGDDVFQVDSGPLKPLEETTDPLVCDSLWQEEAAFIAAANPATVLALVERCKEAERLLHEAKNRLGMGYMTKKEWEIADRISAFLEACHE